MLDSRGKKQCMISRNHARLEFERKGGHWKLIDADSLNGVFVNDVKIKEKVLGCVVYHLISPFYHAFHARALLLAVTVM